MGEATHLTVGTNGPLSKQSVEGFRLRKIRTLDQINFVDGLYFFFVYSSFLLFCFGFINFWLFFASVHIYIIRAFNLRHEKAHLPRRDFKGLNYWISDIMTLPYLPYQEPFHEKAIKHIAHHRSHLPKSKKSYSVSEDPHSLLEQKNVIKAFLSCFFYEEIMFYLDLKKYKGFNKHRLFISTLSIIHSSLIIYFFGLPSLIALMVAYRINMTIAWFSFSYILHTKTVYNPLFSKKIHPYLVRAVEVLLGSGGATAIVYHSFHHTNQNHFIEFNHKA